MGRLLDIACDVDLERSGDSFPAYAVPDGVAIGAGDEVTVHGLPDRLEPGEHRAFRARATLRRASRLGRLWTEWAGVFALTDLYEVGFLPAAMREEGR